MSHIDDLIERLCPNGVAFHPMGEVGEVFRGRRFTKEDYVAEGIGAIHYGELYTRYGIQATDVVTRVRDDLRPNLRFVSPGDVVIAEVGETVEDVGKATAWLGDEDVAIHDGCYGFRSGMDPAFVAYYLQSPDFQTAKNPHVARAKVKRLSLTGLRQISIPVPPLEVQREIVRVLDLFQSLEAELEAELEARRRQYAYYRRLLISVATDTEVEFGEIAGFTYGLTATAQDEGHLRFVRITDINTDGRIAQHPAKFVPDSEEARRFELRRGDVLVARTGASFGKTALIDGADPAVFASFLIRIDVDRNRVRPAFLWHFAQSDLYWAQANSLVSIGGQPQFNANVLGKVRMPLPTLREQDRAIESLNGFDVLVADLSAGLPAELAARRRQYEYYRNRLLTFKEAA